MLLYGTLNQTDKSRAWRAVNPTVGTPITGPAVAAFSDTSAIFALYNNAQSPPGRVIYPDYLKLIVSSAPGITPTSLQIAVSLDTAQRGVTANAGATVANADTDSLGAVTPPLPTASSIAFVQFGALTPTAQSTNRKIVGRSAAKTQASPCLTAGDEIIVIFNQNEEGLGALSGTTAVRIVVPTGLVSIGPGGLMLVHAWMPGLTGAGAGFEYEAGWWELS